MEINPLKISKEDQERIDEHNRLLIKLRQDMFDMVGIPAKYLNQQYPMTRTETLSFKQVLDRYPLTFSEVKALGTKIYGPKFRLPRKLKKSIRRPKIQYVQVNPNHS